MITVFSIGAGWAATRGDFVGDGAVREVVGPAGLLSCAEQGEHWQKRPAARRADKQMTGFTAGRLFEKLQDLRLARFGVQLTFEPGPRAVRTPRLVTTFRLGHTRFCDVPLVHSFRVKKDTPPFTPKGEYLFRVIKTIQSAGTHNENCMVSGCRPPHTDAPILWGEMTYVCL